MILVDSETKVDLLNNEAIALTIIEILRARPDKPVTLGVHGDWGAGKSSVLEMIDATLDGEKELLCIKFNGWRFQGFEDAKIALIEGIVTALVEKRPFVVKAKGALRDLLKRVDVMKLAKRGGGLAWNVATGLPSPDQIESALGVLERLTDHPEELATKENAEAVVKNLGGLLKPAEEKRIPTEIDEFRKAFDKLLEEARVDQLIVLVDDLDRCLPETAIDTLEAIRLFVFTDRTAFIVGADEAMIEYAVRKHFPDLPEAVGPSDYARNYLEKLIQVPFRIPALGETETRMYVALSLVGALVGEDDAGFQGLIAEGRERLKRPWASKPLDAGAVRAALPDRADAALEMLNLSDQTGPLLASGSKGNPRQIKRFLNALLLRKSIATARGFGDEVQLPILAKLMLAERFRPTLFDQIASIASVAQDGKCRELGLLETTDERPVKAAKAVPAKAAPAKAAPANASSDKAKGTESGDSPMVRAWVGSEWVMNWAKLPPKLADVDLRPYLFVAKDKKDYFAASSSLGKLADLVDRLTGQKFAVQSAANEIGRLAPSDAAAVFDELRINIVGRDTYATRPAGIDGMVAIVTAHPQLEATLLDFLDSLPAGKLGVWVAGGWEACIREAENKDRLRGLLEK